MPSRPDARPPAAPSREGAAGGLRAPRALPVVAVLLVALLVAAALSGGVRRTLAQSFARQPERYVELALTSEQASGVCTVRPDGSVVLRAALTSHLARRQDLPWKVTATPAAFPGATLGTVATTPGRTTTFTATVRLVTTPAVVHVSLPGRAERLSLRCGGTS